MGVNLITTAVEMTAAAPYQNKGRLDMTRLGARRRRRKDIKARDMRLGIRASIDLQQICRLITFSLQTFIKQAIDASPLCLCVHH
jgi:hypothetical protein